LERRVLYWNRPD